MKQREMRLPGSVAEIEASPQGEKIIAFFDLDGTIISGFSATYLARDRLRKKEVSLGELLRSIATAIGTALGTSEFEDLLEIGANSWTGRLDDELQEMGERLFQQKIINLIYPEMRQLVQSHQEQGHIVVLCSSATNYQVDPIAKFLGIDNIICNRFSVEDGRLTGSVEKPIIWGAGKARAAQKFAMDADVDLNDCFFYADGDEDLALMHLVGNPRPINPRKKLARVARNRGWPSQRFTSRDSNGALRSLAGVVSVFPIATMGLGLGLLKRDKRAGLNFALPLWVETMFRINGVKLNIIGRENLWAQRPAVFIFNHRNNFDAFMTACLIETDFTGVGKKELENHWLTGTIGKLADMVFIDRDDSKGSVEALKSIEELAKKGISIGVSPEGTRADTQEVGHFKKGPFRMAMAAGIPVVPIVYRNAEVVAARDAGVLSPGTVDVAVLPPIDTSKWTLRSLPKKIESVRQLYIDTLKNWPEE